MVCGRYHILTGKRVGRKRQGTAKANRRDAEDAENDYGTQGNDCGIRQDAEDGTATAEGNDQRRIATTRWGKERP